MKEKLSEKQTIGFNCLMDSAWACACASPTPASKLDLCSWLLGTKEAATDCVRAARKGGPLVLELWRKRFWWSRQSEVE